MTHITEVGCYPSDFVIMRAGQAAAVADLDEIPTSLELVLHVLRELGPEHWSEKDKKFVAAYAAMKK